MSEADLFKFAKQGNLEQVTKLIKNGADVNAKDTRGNTLLYIASIYDHLNVVKFLVKNGAYINARNNDGYTALTPASDNGNLNVVKFLVKNGAYINSKGRLNRTALNVASSSGHLNVVKFLIENGADINTEALTSASYNGHLDIVKFLVENGAYINTKTNLGDTALTVASYNGHLNVVKFLIENRADINAKNEKGETALSIAERNGYRDIVNLLDPGLIERQKKLLEEVGGEIVVDYIEQLDDLTINDYLNNIEDKNRFVIELNGKYSGWSKSYEYNIPKECFGKSLFVLVGPTGYNLQVLKPSWWGHDEVPGIRIFNLIHQTHAEYTSSSDCNKDYYELVQMTQVPIKKSSRKGGKRVRKTKNNKKRRANKTKSRRVY